MPSSVNLKLYTIAGELVCEVPHPDLAPRPKAIRADNDSRVFVRSDGDRYVEDPSYLWPSAAPLRS